MRRKPVEVRITLEMSTLPDFLSFLKEEGIPWTVIKPVRIPPTWEVASDVYSMLRKGKSVRKIAACTGISRATVSRIGRDPEKYLLDSPPIGKDLH